MKMDCHHQHPSLNFNISFQMLRTTDMTINFEVCTEEKRVRARACTFGAFTLHFFEVCFISGMFPIFCSFEVCIMVSVLAISINFKDPSSTLKLACFNPPLTGGGEKRPPPLSKILNNSKTATRSVTVFCIHCRAAFQAISFSRGNVIFYCKPQSTGCMRR